MANKVGTAVPVLAGELHDLVVELQRAYATVWLVVEAVPAGQPGAGLHMSVQCMHWPGRAPQRHYRASTPLPDDKTPDLSRRAYNLLWGALDHALARGYIPHWEPDPDPTA